MKKILNVFLCCILILAAVLGNVTVVNAETLENVALSKTAVASDIEKSTRPASNAVDGKTSTHWAGLSHTSWLYVDLGGVYEVDSVNVLTYPSGSRYYNYEVLGTLDGATWTKIGEKTDTTAETSSGTTFEAGNEKYCCVKIQFLYNSDNSKVHMKELRVYGTEVADEESYPVFQFNMAKAELSELVEEYEAEYEASDYTEETWSTYETALNTAKELLENTEGTAEDVQNTIASLKTAAEGLVYQVYENPEGTYRFASTNLYAMGPGGIDVDGMLKKFYNRYAVDFAGLQEVDRNTTRNPFDTMAELTTDTRFVDYAFNKNMSYQGGEYGIGIVSTTEIKETTSGLYTKLGSEEQRGWVRTVIELDGKEVAFYNTHLSTGAKPIVSNMAEIIQIMDEDPLEYKILTADFNCNREWMYPFLVNYNLLNGKDGAWYQTHGGYIDTPFSTANGIDNIITSRNIEVVDFQVVDSLGLSDHNFIYADLKLLDKEVPSKEYLNIEVTDAKKLEAADYTEETWAAVEAALADAEALTDEASQEEINAVLFALQDSVKNLVRIYPLISEGKTVTVDGEITSGAAGNINDGDVYTTLKTPFFTDMIIDLDELCRIDEIQVFPYGKKPCCYYYTLYTSIDGVNYEYFGEKTSDEIASIKTGDVFEKENCTARYIKIEMTDSSNESDTSGVLGELKVYGEALAKVPADYTAVEEALAKVPADLSIYTDETVKALEDAVNAVVEGKNITEQTIVDGYAVAIEDAVRKLVLKPADYTAVEEALAKVPADLTIYTDETIAELNEALNAVVEGKDITEQAAVDGYAGAIEAAILKLQFKDADYAKVNEAKEKIPSDLSIYTSETVKALEDAVNAVVEDKNITEQSIVDEYANAINSAIDGLVVKDADYTTVDAALAKVPTDLTIYTEETVKAVNDAVAAVVEGKKITEQSEVDAMAKAIEDAIVALKEKTVVKDEVIRIAGADRYATGYKVADTLKEALGVEKFDAVIVATGKNFADALSGSYLAVVKNAPILLTNGKDDNVAMLHEYIRANVTAGGKVYILGGEEAVPTEVEAIEGYEVVRLSGPSRYDTNLAILEEAGFAGGDLIVATGKDFADSLSASAVQKPILLVKPGAVLTDEQKAIIEVAKEGTIYIVGGEGAVDAATATELRALGTVERVYGANRRETSVAIAKKFFTDVETVVVANAGNFPDGLCGGPLAAAMDAPLILTADDKSDEAAGYVADNSIEKGYVLGGDAALSNETVEIVFELESVEEIIVQK